ncbi:MAG TPA: HAMP domain-containing sensor histidine kinase, partial [Acidimicrobiales bacterium]|nr:HAMP domain-containing sensor histidine kinase [Acidimicrobiales bacterium]
VVGGEVPGGPRLYLFFPLDDEAADLELLRNVLASVGVGLVLMSALVGVAAAGGTLRPLRRARVAAHRLEVGLLGTRLPEEGNDEFAELARAFNRMADALERTVADLRALEASHRRFVSDVAHELRTPLTALTTAADVLDANAGGLNDAGRRSARLLVVESRRLAAMVEDLMEISRLDAGVAAMTWEPVDVRELVEKALARRGWEDRVEVVAGERVGTWADPRRVDAIVANLVGNALEHGGPPVRVAVVAAGQEAAVTVSDAGPGIPPEQLGSVFERFYKADPSRTRDGRSRGGSGLGLAIARENARLHGGDVTVASDPGRGSRFTATLPLRSGPPGPGPAWPERRDGPGPERRGRPAWPERRGREEQEAAVVAEPLPGGDASEKTARHDAVVVKAVVVKRRRSR